jgi:hypothetical protein
MSFLLVSGKIFICSECNRSVKVNYKEGALPTQIGDIEITHQLELSSEIGQPNSDPNEEGYYLYDIGMCEKCYFSLIDESERKRSSEISRCIHGIITARDERINAFSSLNPTLFEDVVSKITLAEICSALSEDIASLTGDKHDSISKKQRLKKAFIHKYKSEIESYILNKCWSEPCALVIVERFNTATKALMKALKIAIGSNNLFCISKRTNATESLNEYITAYTTIREPLNESPNESFYFNREVDLAELLDLVKIKCESSEIPNLPDTKQLIVSMLDHLTSTK